MIFVDTNFFLRFLIRDENHQYWQAKEFFLQAEERGEVLLTDLVVIFEIYWVLKSFYKKKRKTIVKILVDLISLDFIYFPEKEKMGLALQFFVKTNFDLEDCYHLVYALNSQAEDLVTFDRQLKKYFLKLKDGAEG